jgi:hypothetical protein
MVGLTTITSACTQAIISRAVERPATQQAAAAAVPGVPNRPDLVTVVPFVSKPNESAIEQGLVMIPAEVDGHRGNFMVDLGAPDLMLNREFLQPSPNGGVDTADLKSWPDRTEENDARTWHKVRISLRIGTLLYTFNDPLLDRYFPLGHPNAVVNHHWNHYDAPDGPFAPRLGHIGVAPLEPFETIIDYTRRRVVLIRLDAAGRRLVDVPAYTPKWSAPIIDSPANENPTWNIKVVADTTKDGFKRFTLDTINPGNNTKTLFLDTGAPFDYGVGGALGTPFLSPFGVVGFNHRTHQFILYRVAP